MLTRYCLLWQLVVIISALAQGRSAMAAGVLVGSAISNILGAFSIGLLLHRSSEAPSQFDRSSRIYSLILLILTTFAVPALHFNSSLVWRVCGVVLVVCFAFYVASIAWAIRQGAMAAPEGSVDDSSDEEGSTISENSSNRTSGSVPRGDETDRLLPHSSGSAAPTTVRQGSGRQHSLVYHIFHLILGFASICLAGYVLSHAAANITEAVGLSDVLVGVVILAIATTLPEKLVAGLSGYRGHIGILFANTAGSNIFLLSLCLGILMLGTSASLDGGNVEVSELVVLWASTLALNLVIWFGGTFTRWVGGAMLLGYVAFIILECVVIHPVIKAA
jgi:Ca2+/Na+ antiporter